jgi:hypothetical protein
MKTYYRFFQLEEDIKIPKDIKLFIKKICETHNEQDIKQEDDFIFLLGGSINLIEKLEDLKKVLTAEPYDKENRWKNITETTSVYDVAYYFSKCKFTLIGICTNNAGGDVYLIPEEISKLCNNLKVSMKKSNFTVIEG